MAPDYSEYTYSNRPSPTLDGNAIRRMEELMMTQMMTYDEAVDRYGRYWKIPRPMEYPMAMKMREEPHYCREIPEKMVPYYKQLVDYYIQSGFKKKESEKLCCVLNRLGINYNGI